MGGVVVMVREGGGVPNCVSGCGVAAACYISHKVGRGISFWGLIFSLTSVVFFFKSRWLLG